MRRQEELVGRFSVSFPRGLIDAVDKMAERRGVNRSRLLAELVVEAQSRDLAAEMSEGYRELAAMNRDLAETALPAIAEVVLRND
ncbi:MAG TPA: CopG family transcriptional regulator [Chloroflexota bacterium]|nr:CopG family transcriptional regulator [Chloroflexota bacterium]